MLFENPEVIALIQKHIPGFNFGKNLTRHELQSALRIARIKESKQKEEIRIKSRIEIINKKKINPGTKIVDRYCKGKKFTVKSITALGYIQVIEKKGVFNPERIERTI